MKLVLFTTLLTLIFLVLLVSCAVSINHQVSIQSAPVNGTTATVVKGTLNNAKKKKIIKITGGGSLKKIPLEKSGKFFILPIYVGTARTKSEKKHPDMRKYHVKLDVASEHTYLFSDDVRKNLQDEDQTPVFTRTNKMVYNFYKGYMEGQERSPTYKMDDSGDFFTSQQRDGSRLYGDTGFETFEVAGMRMPQVKFAFVTGGDPEPGKPKSKKHIDITGFDGSLGLGLRNYYGGEKEGGTGRLRSLWNSIMKKTIKVWRKGRETISIYICCDGQAGQLGLGGVDKRLLATDSRVKYVPVPSIEGEYPHYWAVNLVLSARLGTQMIAKDINRVAIIDSAHPYISAPKEDIDRLFQSLHMWPKNDVVMLTSRRRKRTECDILNAMRKPYERTGCPTIMEPPLPRNAPMVSCLSRNNIGTLTLKIGDYSVSFTGMEMSAEEVPDQDTYPDMCELFFDISPSSEWRLGVPFLQKAGMTVLDKKTLQVGFAPVRHSEKVCGPIKKSTA